MPLPPQPLSDARHSILVVLLHAYRHTPKRLDWVKKAVKSDQCESEWCKSEECKSDQCESKAHVIVPELPLQMWSMADLNEVACNVVARQRGRTSVAVRHGATPRHLSDSARLPFLDRASAAVA